MKMKIKEKTKAWAIVIWFIASFVLFLMIFGTFQFSRYGIPAISTFLLFALSARCTIRNAEMIEKNIKMID